jgi:hypothetical protein
VNYFHPFDENMKLIAKKQRSDWKKLDERLS